MAQSKDDRDKRVVISGVGVATPLGHTQDAFCSNLHAGKFGIAPFVGVDQSFLKFGIGGQIVDLPEPEWKNRLDQKNSSEITSMTLYCAQQAVAQSHLVFDIDQADRYGVVIGSGFQNLFDLEPVFRDYFRHDKKVGTMTIPRNMSSAPASRIAMYYDLHGFVNSVSSACSSGFTAILNGVHLIQAGHQDVVIAGGTDLMLAETLILSWERMRVLSRTNDPQLACRPFSKDREGIGVGDGCALFVIESLAHAEARGAQILAEITGIYQNSDSMDLVKPNAAGEIACMKRAITQAGLTPGDIDVIFAHATGTPLNDEVEYEALLAVFGDQLQKTPVCAIKAMTGHTMGASGPLSLSAALGSFEQGYIYPVPNYHEPDPAFDLAISTEGTVVKDLSHILLNTFAFGGINVSLVISRW